MSRTFLYARVSTSDQTTDNQVLQAVHAGYAVEPHRIHTETISGTVPAMERPIFASMLPKLEPGDTLVVAKLDRLGRNAADVDRTVESLEGLKVRVVVLDMPIMEVTSAAGNMVRRMFAVFAQFERDQLVERTHAGLARARAEGKPLGRREVLAVIAKKRGVSLSALHQEIKEKRSSGATARRLAEEYGVSHPTILKAAEVA